MASVIQVYTELFNFLQIPIITPATGSLVLGISLLTSFFSVSSIFKDYLRNPFFFNIPKQSYDFIIVGAGSAGSVLANRLSDNGLYKVLVLEAGGDPNVLNSIPELAPYNLHQTSTDWRYVTVPQENACLGMYNQQLRWPRAKALGGCSSHNWMIYQRGCHLDYDQWVEATNDTQWNYDNLLPFFKKSENYHGWFPNPAYHGTQGLLHVSRNNYLPSLTEWVAGGSDLGYDTTTDPNGRQVPGFYPTDVTIYTGMREDTYRAFLVPSLERPNLFVSRYSHVIKIEIDENKKATGVTYIKDGKTLTATATKEVIMSAGAIGTPHLLMLSGLGPSENLKSVGITPKVDLPGVGQNLQDHVLTMFGPFLLNASISFITDRDLTIGSVYEYVKNGTGPFSFNELSGVGFIATSQSTDPSWSNIEFHHSPIGMRYTAADDWTALFGLKPKLIHKYFEPYLLQDANFVLADLGRPHSRGDIKLQSKDPFVHPLIDPKYYSKREDMDAMIEALQFVLNMYENTTTWQKVGATLTPTHLPGCEKHTLRSREYLECYLRTLTFTIYHPCGTARMGMAGDNLAVVDGSNLKVRGVTGLRIADASVFPVTPNANLNAPSILIGEKASDFILKTWQS